MANDHPFDLKNPKPPFKVKGAAAVSRMSKDQLVRFLPSSYVTSRIPKMGFWVRYKKAHEFTEEIKLVFKTYTVAHFDCPDREILLVSDATESQVNYRPLDSNWDKFVSMSLTHGAGNDNMFDRIMVNPHLLTNIEKRMEWKGSKKYNQTDLLVNSDSGGFQLRAGTSDWVDPEEIIEFYNRQVDEGFTLDIPSAGLDEEMFDDCARIQVKNSKKFKEGLRKGVRLGQIIHGTEIRDMKRYRRIVEAKDSDFDLVSIPSSMSLPALKQIDRVAYMLCNGPQYPQFHQLGLYTISSTIATVWLAHQMKRAGRTMMFTNDSSTPAQSGVSCIYHSSSFFTESIKRMMLSNEVEGNPGRAINPYKTLNCQCMSCSNLKYSDVMSYRFEATKWFLIRHNESEFVRWIRRMNIFARDMDFQQYKEFAHTITSGGQRIATMQALDYVEVLMNEGYAKTHKRFSHLTTAMFSSNYDETAGLWETDDLTTSTVEAYITPEKVKHLGKVIKRYKKYYGL